MASLSSESSFKTINETIYNNHHLIKSNYFHISNDNYMISSESHTLIDGLSNDQSTYESYVNSNGFNESDIDSDLNVFYHRPEEMLLPWVHNSFFYPTMVTYILTFIFGVSGNSVVIWFMLGDKTNRSVTSVFLVSLAISDLLLLTIVAPLDIAHYFVVQWDVNGKVCKMAAFAESVSAFASILNLVAVTFERFIVIVFPLRSRSLCTMENCKNFVILVWALSMFLALPTINIKEIKTSTFYNHQNTTITLYDCKESRDTMGLYLTIYRFIFLFALPSIFMIVLYTWVITELWISTRTMDELTNNSRVHRSESRASISRDTCSSPTNHTVILRSHYPGQETRDVKSARKQVIKMLILVVILFLTCWGPRLIGEIMLICGMNFAFNYTTYVIRIVFFLLPFIHSCLNPIVYCLMSSKFRKKIIDSIDQWFHQDRVSAVDLSSRIENSNNGHLTSIYTIHNSFETVAQ
ncbi:galanin receptor 2a-like [Panonychus citri]|uniref:galanin receptor 2a-like n=1 Tax=Panonychus citri TaxID=50023 RepID=UPI002307566C|nr:galanin receptor 2a-like [Panonychus citri]